MSVVLVDTSVWIDFFKNRINKNTQFIFDRPPEYELAVCPVIIQEVLQGVATDKKFRNIKLYFNDLIFLDNNLYELAVSSAQLYRDLRKKGITIRKPNDCLIAAYAIHNDSYLLHDDRDFDFIAQNCSLKLLQL